MLTESSDAAAVRVPPPLVFLAAVVLGWSFQAFVVALPLALPLMPRIALTALVGLAAVGLMAGALTWFRRTAQDPKPWTSSPELIVSGVYRFTRNPMYVAMALLQGAIGIGAANAWILVLTPLSIVVVYRTAIRHEEAYLERKFGASYVTYRATVRRWL